MVWLLGATHERDRTEGPERMPPAGESINSESAGRKSPFTAYSRLLSKVHDLLVCPPRPLAGGVERRPPSGLRGHLPAGGRLDAGRRPDLLQCPRGGGEKAGRHVCSARRLDQLHAGGAQTLGTGS